jgi:GT2 family glycosyltransferase
VLVVHQDLPGTGVTRAAVEEALAGSWPFEVVLSTSDRVGACRARNLGLARVEADWIFLLDDDVRLPPRCLEHLHGTAVAYGVEAVCAAVYIPRLESVPTDIRVRSWPSLPSGAAFVSRRAAQEAGGFDERLEHGWGEDYEWGIRLRLAGTEVALTSHEPVQHLKAETGGFRAPIRRPWDDDPVRPRPAPTVVLSRRLHASREMRTGYRLFYALSRLGRTAWWRWPREVVRIPGEFRRALHWATELEEGGVRDTGGRG